MYLKAFLKTIHKKDENTLKSDSENLQTNNKCTNIWIKTTEFKGSLTII